MWINRLNNYNNMLKINYLIIWISVKCTSTNALLDDYSFINYDLWHWQNSLIRYHTMHDRHTYNMLFGRWFTYNSLGDSILLAFPFFFYWTGILFGGWAPLWSSINSALDDDAVLLRKTAYSVCCCTGADVSWVLNCLPIIWINCVDYFSRIDNAFGVA